MPSCHCEEQPRATMALILYVPAPQGSMILPRCCRTNGTLRASACDSLVARSATAGCKHSLQTSPSKTRTRNALSIGFHRRGRPA